MKIKEMEYGKERKTELLCKDKYKNYNYYVLNLGTHPTAYIEIPKEDKLYGKSYDEIYRIGCDIDVNGGLTYSNNELMGISSDNWFIGWDYAHCGDYCGYEETMPESIRTYGKKWTTKEIIEECKNAIDQIVEFEESLEEENKEIENYITELESMFELSELEEHSRNILKVGIYIKQLQQENQELKMESEKLTQLWLDRKEKRRKAIEYLEQPYRDNFDYSKAELLNILQNGSDE